ncbi:MAG: DedA family protein [Actinomycetota bacterium]|nr:DedA family protein [Actinomycetota bacterium]MDD5666751.1 DedA family protein [Actinomycetota bacterium]
MDGSFIDRFLDWVMPLFSSWGYLIVFAGVFLESIFLTGWIAPGTTVILIGSFYAAQGELNVFMLWVTSVVAALLGDNVGYFIGRRLGRTAVERYNDKPRLRKGIERSQGFFARYGGVTVLFGRMLSGVDAFIPVTAGINRMPHWKYMAYDVPGAMLWSGIFCALGYFFGNNWRTIDNIINWLGWGLLGLIILLVAAWLLLRRRRKSGGSAMADD